MCVAEWEGALLSLPFFLSFFFSPYFSSSLPYTPHTHHTYAHHTHHSHHTHYTLHSHHIHHTYHTSHKHHTNTLISPSPTSPQSDPINGRPTIPREVTHQQTPSSRRSPSHPAHIKSSIFTHKMQKSCWCCLAEACTPHTITTSLWSMTWSSSCRPSTMTHWWPVGVGVGVGVCRCVDVWMWVSVGVYTKVFTNRKIDRVLSVITLLSLSQEG